MLSIKTSQKYEETVKNSKFIALIFRVQNIDDINNYLEKVKGQYPNATHYCYGYIIDNIERFSDDKEPAKTAGLPILNQIKSHKLNYTLIIVVRYFGGIKLGTGLLTRTYSKLAKEVSKEDNIISLAEGLDISISFNYNDIKDVDHILSSSKIISKDFNDRITYRAYVEDNTLNKLSKYDIQINNKIYIEKE